MLRVICLDPGVTTGIATGWIDEIKGTMEVGSAEEKFEVWDIYDYLVEHAPNFVVYERFEFRRTRTPNNVELYPREVIGVIRLYCHSTGLLEKKTYPRMPGQDWQYFTDKKLKDDNVYKATKGGHANDAVRHLLGWYTFGAGYRYNVGGYRPA